MKFFNNYLTYIAILALIFSSCSKDEPAGTADSPEVQFVDLSFGAVLNDLSNRAMSSMSKTHFDAIPDCSEELPAIAVLEISYEGQGESTMGPIVVDILSDETGFFTDYSDQLKVPVPDNGSVSVSLDSFMVYDGNSTPEMPYGNLIWIAPVESEEGEFDGYVDQSLPFSFDVEDGTKPYIDVEVLCFDRRLVNEYGYVFFDILPEVIYPLCLFVNYCDENGRHYVADYSIDLYFGQDATGIQLYDNTMDAAMAMTGDYGNGAYYADPLCLVVPGPPANLPDDAPYLYLVIYPEDWDGTGDINNSPIPVSLSWNDVNELLNADGETNEYLHLLIGECEGALNGDGGNGGSECNESDATADCDDDGVLNRCDPDNANFAGFDCDQDGIPNGQENEGCIDNDDLNCGVIEPATCDLTIPDPAEGCIRALTPGSDPVDYSNNGEFLMIESIEDGTPIPLFEDTGNDYGPAAGNFVPSISGTSFTFEVNPNANLQVTDYLVEIKDVIDGDVSCVNAGTAIDGSFTYPIYLRVSTNICPTN